MPRILSSLLNRLAFSCPGGSSIRPRLQRRRGVSIGRNVWIGLHVYIDDLHPSGLTIGDNCTIGIRSTILTHFYWGPRREGAGGKVVIGPNVFIGPHCVVLPNVTIGEGSVIKAGTVLWAAGVLASPAAKWLGVEADKAGRIKVNPDLTVPGSPNIIAIGDAVTVNAHKGKPVPGIGDGAKQAGKYAARLIKARLEGRTLPPFEYKHLGDIATIGRSAAVIDFVRRGDPDLIAPAQHHAGAAHAGWHEDVLLQIVGIALAAHVLDQNAGERNAVRRVRSEPSRLAISNELVLEKNRHIRGLVAVVLPSRLVLLCVGDVAGHGIDAATSMVVLRNALRGLAVTGARPAQLLSWLNMVAHHLTGGVTATAVCGLYDPERRRLRWARAGHLPPVLTRRA